MHIEVDIPVEKALRTPVDVFRAPRRHEGAISNGPPDPPYRAFELLYLAYVVVPAIAGASKWVHALANWSRHLAPAVSHAVGTHSTLFLDAIGVAEVALAAFVLIQPRLGGYAVAAWLALGVLNFALTPGHFGLALCLAALALGAIAMSLLAKDYGRRPQEGAEGD